MKEQKNWEDFFTRFNDFKITEEHRKIAQRIHELVPHAEDIIDIGCGSGEYSVCLSERFPRVISLDISERIITNLKNRIGNDTNITPVAMDYAEYEESHDVSFLSFSPAIQSEEDLKKVLRLSKKGIFILTVDAGSMDYHRRNLLKLFPPKEKSGFIKNADWFRFTFRDSGISYEEFPYPKEWEEPMEKNLAVSCFTTYFKSFGYADEETKNQIVAYVNEHSENDVFTEHHVLNKVLFYVKK